MLLLCRPRPKAGAKCAGPILFSQTCILGHNKLRKTILNNFENQLYVFKTVKSCILFVFEKPGCGLHLRAYNLSQVKEQTTILQEETKGIGSRAEAGQRSKGREWGTCYPIYF